MSDSASILPSSLRPFFIAMTRIALALVALAGGATPGLALTMDERAACHEAIERVYWSHRTWPEANPGRRPSFAASVPETTLLHKAEEAVLMSAALAELWHRPIDGAALQAELDRVARNTRRPAILREIFEALDDDPERIAECLARPVLAERRLRRWYATDSRWHGDLRQRAEDALATVGDASGLKWLPGDYSEIAVGENGGGAVDPVAVQNGASPAAAQQWAEAIDFLARAFDRPAGESAVDRQELLASLPLRQVSRLQEDDGRFYAVAVLEKASDRLRVALVEWPKRPFDEWWSETKEGIAAIEPAPGADYRLPELSEGGCLEDTWQPTRAPIVERILHTAVWTGSEMLIWGGFPFREDLATYGGRYDPVIDNWQLIATWNAPASRGRHTAVWTGSEMIVWGGEADGLQVTDTGGRYDPVSNTWQATSTVDAPSPRKYQSAVWTGSEMIIWGGCGDSLCDVFPVDGGRYDPLADAWSATSTSGAPDGRYGQATAWTGSRLVVWGGWTGAAVTASGGRYDPVSDSWSDTDTAGAPQARFFPSTVWTASEMIVWGGREGEFSTVYFATGGRYDPVFDSWTPTSTVGAPSARDSHAAAWTGSEMIVWGGYDGNNEVNTGGRYDPATDSWTPTSTLNAPSPRIVPTAVWTGSEMVLWAGQDATGASLADGARYDPASDSWVPVGLPATPTERSFHSTVWTGTEMIVWGGCGVFAECPTRTGGIYDPITDTWQPTNLVGAPSDREFHNVVWTGSEMILWGGCADAFCFVRLNDGGRYEPVTDSWQPMSTLNAPSTRYWHDGVWTGTEMIVWGGCHNKDCTDTNPPLPRDGGRYDPSTDSWTPTNEVDAPGGRWFLTTTWTGTEMIVWGGEDMDVGRLNSGFRYSPSTDSWTPMTLVGAPEPRSRHRSHWIGDRLLVWGGNDLSIVYNTGGLYDPVGDSWTSTSTAGAPSPRAYPYTAWTGQEMLAWGGFCDTTPECSLNDGAFYDPAAQNWRSITDVEAPLGRADLWGPVWTGSEMMLFGGTWPATLQELRTGGIYCAGEVLPPPPPLIFADGFESGDTSHWSGSTP